jgi:hypothetical protein
MTLYERLIETYNRDLTHSGINGERITKRLDELSKIIALSIRSVANSSVSSPFFLLKVH